MSKKYREGSLLGLLEAAGKLDHKTVWEVSERMQECVQ